MCSLSFSQKWLLKRHWKTHTGAKPYRCTICSRLFSLRDSCTRQQHRSLKILDGFQVDSSYELILCLVG